MSMRDNFAIGKGEDSDLVYQCVADMMGRTLSFTKYDSLVTSYVDSFSFRNYQLVC